MNLDGNIFFLCNKYNKMISFTLLERFGFAISTFLFEIQIAKWLSVNYFNPEYFP